ncbi:MAG: FHA domain-containing protein, partial [Planctomycetota bacterium]
MRRLVVLEGRAEPGEIEAGDRPILVGRAREADLRLFDERVSRHHARLHEEAGRMVLEDLGSANGTRLNGEPVEGPAALFDGDRILIGGVLLGFVTADGADRPTVAGAGEGRVEAALDPEAADPAATAGEEAARRRLGFL